MSDALLLAGLIFMVAILYSSVGQAGGTGYLAALALVGTAPEAMRPTALALNVIVAGIATFQFYRAGKVSLRHLAPFLLASIPLAYLGGSIDLSTAIYNPIVGVVLIVTAVRMLVPLRRSASGAGDGSVPRARAVASGGAIGLLSGLTGTGGGVYLGPLLMLTGWVAVGTVPGITASFNLVNSVAALAGNLLNVGAIPPAFPLWGLAAVCGGFLGAGYGSRRLDPLTTQRLLGVILAVAGVRLLVFG